MPLFLVQDDDRPMYVLAEDWTAALTEWRDKIADENDEDGIQEESYNPRGISLVAEDNDILIQRKVQAEMRNPSCKDPWHTAVRRETERCPSCGFEPEVYKRLRESGAWQKSGLDVSDTSDAVREGFGEQIENLLRHRPATRDSQPLEAGINDPPINSPIKCPNCESMSYYTDGHHQPICSVCNFVNPN